MGFIQDLEKTILDKVLSAVSKFFEPVVKPLQKFWGAIKKFFSALIDVVPETITLVTGVISEINAWRSFREHINFKTGVISLISVRDHIEDLIHEVIDAWNAVKDLIANGFKLPVKSINEAAEAAEEVVVAFEDFFGKFGLEAFLKRLVPQLEKAGGKVLEVLALLEAIAEALLQVVRELQTVLNAVRDIRQTFQTGEGLFLSQKNPRKTLQLSDGTSIKIRLGKLHSE